MDPKHLHRILPPARVPMETTMVGIDNRCRFIYIYFLRNLTSYLSFLGPVADDVYHSEEDPPPFHENQDFDFGFDNKSIRRAFIRKVRTLCTVKEPTVT